MSGRGLDRLREERGSALVVAILVTVMLLALGLGTLAFADGQSRQGGNERIQESTFNLTEAAMRQQLFLLSKSWPSSAPAYPTCTQATAASETRCPDDSGLRSSYKENDPSNRDYSAGYSWETRVQDNGDCVEDYYTIGGASGTSPDCEEQPGWDQNGDQKVWVRASSKVRDRTRTVVTLVTAKRVSISFFPRQVITAGSFSTSGGGKPLVNTEGQTGQPSGVQVRCPSVSPPCVSSGTGHVSPSNVTAGYTGGDAMTAEELNGLRGIARQNGTYYASGCPSSLTGNMAGLPPKRQVVFIESGNCSYTGNSVFNSAASPGTVVIATGTLSLGGTVDFYGLVYGANKQRTTEAVVSTGGSACIQGAVTVDGEGRVGIGTSNSKCPGGKGRLIWDPTAIDQLETYGQASTVDGTWRELCVRQTDGTDCPSP